MSSSTPASITTATCRIRFLMIWSFLSRTSAWELARLLIPLRLLARIMERFESVVLNEQPHLVLVVGDVNSTAACALVAKKTWCRGDEGANDFIPKLAH